MAGEGPPRFHSFALSETVVLRAMSSAWIGLIPGGDFGGTNFDQRGDLVSQNLAQCNIDIREGHIELCDSL